MDEAIVRLLIAETLRTYAGSLNFNAKYDNLDSVGGAGLDVFDDPVLTSETNGSDKIMRGISRMKDVIGVIPIEEKVAFVEACFHCPNLVQQESHPKKFLLRHDFNVFEASQSLVRYWSLRREVFTDRAYLPLNLTGKGALRAEDVEALRSGFLIILPPDNLGRQVLFTDFSRLPDISDGVLLRTAFFVRSILACNKDAPKEGYIGVEIFNSELEAVFERPVAKTLTRIQEHSIPTFSKMTYVVKLQRWALFRLLSSSPHLSEGLWRQMTPLIANSVDQLREKLQKLQFDLSSVPEVLGGSWRMHNFQAWLKVHESLNPNVSSTAAAPLPYSFSFRTKNKIKIEVESFVRDMIEAIELIPEEKKAAYSEAMARCPFLVRTESNPIRFVRCECGDYVAAAGRLVRYWELRKRLFKERAFKPLTFQEGGVFSDNGIQRLQAFCSSARILPCDRRGRPVLCWNPVSSNQLELTMEEKRNYCFYLFSVISEYSAAQEQGFVFVIVLPSASTSERFQLSMHAQRKMLLSSFPIKDAETRCFTVTKSSNEEFFTMMLNSISHAQGHVAQSNSQILEEFESLGLDKDGIPEEWGGLWGPDNDHQWRQIRDNMEKNRRAAEAFQPVPDTLAPQPSEIVPDELLFLETSFQETMIRALTSVPDAEKGALSRALILCPEIVRSESDPWKFVALYPENLSVAVHHMARYWCLREKLFGRAAYLPLGPKFEHSRAAEKADAVDRKPNLLQLPGRDYHGRITYFLEDAGDFSSTSWERAAFFTFAPLCLAKQSGKLEEVVLIYRSENEATASDNLEVAINFMREIFPLKLSRLFVCSVRDSMIQKVNESSQARSLQLEIRRSMDEALVHATSIVYAVNNHELIGRLNLTYGVCRESLRFLISDDENVNKSSAVPNVIARKVELQQEVHRVKVCSMDSEQANQYSPGSHIDAFHEGPSPLKVISTLVPFDAHDVNELIKATLNMHLADCVLKTQRGPEMNDSLKRKRRDGDEFFAKLLGNNPAVKIPGMAHMMDAIQILPTEEKVAFVEACARSPTLVQQESHPTTFLVKYGHDVLKAAQGLVHYWSIRRKIFGDRAYLPLNLTGKGALNDEDVEAFRTGFLMILPPDNLGRYVLFTDFSRARNISDGVLLRTFFFVHAMLSCGKNAPQKGYVAIYIYNKELKTVLERPVAKTLAFICDDSMPIFAKSTILKLQKWTSLHSLQCSTAVSGGLWKQFTPLIANSVEQLREKLQKFHFDLSRIPAILGGTWSIMDFHSWLHRQNSVNPKISCTVVDPLPRSTHHVFATGMEERRNNVESGIREVVEAIELIPVNKKCAFLEAMGTCPFLVRSESNPFFFLRCEAGDAVAAAGRLIQYWESRKQFFKNRAFNPMTFLAGGVFSDTDRQRLKDFRTVRVLPCDQRGRPVLWWDSSYDKGLQLTLEEKLKYWFYLFSVMAEQTAAQEQGILFFVVPHTNIGGLLSLQSLRSTLLNSFPVRALETRCIAMEERSNEHFLTLVLNSLSHDTQGQIAHSQAEMFDELISLGLGKEGIPVEYSGSWDLANDQSWRHSRNLIEEDRCGAASFQPTPDAIIPKSRELVQDESFFLKTSFHGTMNEALKPLPHAEKAALLHALASCPEVVRSESNPWTYVALEPGNLPEAAYRIARYWNFRQSLFGDAAFLPLGLKMENFQIAEDERDEDAVGSFVLLSELDSHGRHVFLANNIVGDLSSSANWQRRAFRVLAHMCFSQKLETSEATLIFRAEDIYPSTAANIKVLVDLINQIFPLRLVRLFVCFVVNCSVATGKSMSTNSRMSLQLGIRRELGERLSGLTTVQCSMSNHSLLDRLAKWQGMSLESLRSAIVSESGGKKKATTMVTARTQGDNVNEDFLALMGQALEQVPSAERSSYELAKSKVPNLIENESSPRGFLKCEKNDYQRAISRLARYWSQRAEIFKERALQPLNQTFEGALNKGDVTNLSSGYIALLPNDSEGRPVLLHDCSRLEGRLDAASEKRNLFYWAMLLSQDEASIEKGVVLLVVVDGINTYAQLTRLVDLTNQCFPFWYHAIHLIPRQPNQGAHDRFVQTLSSLPGAAKTKVQVYTMEDALADLRANGFNQEGLPKCVEGEWTYEKFEHWQDYRLRVEWDLPGGAGEERGYRATPLPDLTEAEKAERKRRFNILHSRRKRQRDRVEQEALQCQVLDLKRERHDLLVERDRLESLLHNANRLIK